MKYEVLDTAGYRGTGTAYFARVWLPRGAGTAYFMRVGLPRMGTSSPGREPAKTRN